MTHDELMQTLINNDGAVLYWQLPREVVEAAIAAGACHIADDDCLVHHDAIKIGEGSYTLRH